MSLGSQKSGNQFGGIKRSGVLTPDEWAVIMLEQGFPADPKVIAEGLGNINAESGFNSDPGGDGAHFGAWQEDSSFGTVAQRLDPVHSTRTARERWEADGKSFYPAWGRWQAEQSGHVGASDYPQYMATAQKAISAHSSGGKSFGEEIPLIGGAVGDVENAIGGVVGGALDAGEFLAEVAETLLDFRKLGQLAVEAFAWFIRLLLKALWDYVVAPLWHWAERAESWYWRNFFGVGTERGSGFGYLLRENAGIVTIGFWALGYAILWTDGESLSLSPVEPHESMLGRTVKGVEGKIARRNLIKPSRVEEETPDKPKPKTSTVKIEQVKEFSVSRKRPVSVGEVSTGRNQNERRSNGVPRPGHSPAQTQKKPPQIVLPPGVEREQKGGKKGQVQKTAKQTPAKDRPRADSRISSGDRS